MAARSGNSPSCRLAPIPRSDGRWSCHGGPSTYQLEPNPEPGLESRRAWSRAFVPVLLHERIWLTTALETNVRTFTEGPSQMQQAERVVLGVVCLEKSTGRQLYCADVFSVTNPTAVNSLNSYATPTPVVEKGRLYCDFGTFGTACLEADTGRVLWQRPFPTGSCPWARQFASPLR